MSTLWPRVDRVIDACLNASPELLVAHGIGLLAAERLRIAGQPLPPLLQSERQVATQLFLAARSLLERIRALLDGQMILIKGPEVASHYADPLWRSYGDLDILVPDSSRARGMLLAAGFIEVDDYEFAHTQRPLRWPGSPLVIELHHDLPWLRWMMRPPVAAYFATPIPSRTEIPGVDTLPPLDHALFVAAHAWGHAPLRRLGDLIDVTAMTEGQDRQALQTRAQELKVDQVWQTTLAACDALLDGDPGRYPGLPFWARHLYPPRERSVTEVHVARWVGAFWAPTVSGKARNLVATARADLGPLPGESWPEKLARTTRALRDANAPALLRQRDS